MRLGFIFSAVFALVVSLSTDEAAAQSADRLSAGVAANVAALTATKLDLAAVPAVRAADQEANDCFGVARARGGNVGDLSAGDLRALRECIVGAFANLFRQMEALKSLQRNAIFDYALFAETSRLLADTNAPGQSAIAPFQAMLEAASLAAQNESERIVLGELQSFTETIAQDGGPG